MNRIELTKPYVFFTAFLVVSISILPFLKDPVVNSSFILFSYTLFTVLYKFTKSFSDKDENLTGSIHFK